MNTLIGLKLSICQQLVIWNQTTASEGKKERQKSDLPRPGLNPAPTNELRKEIGLIRV